MVVYYALSKVFPDRRTFITDDDLQLDGTETKEGATDAESASSCHKHNLDVDTKSADAESKESIESICA